jgi:HK97 family phage portal protein
MMQAFLADRVLTGNAYLVKVRSAAGIPVQLWWVPSWMMEPRWPEDGKEFLSHYDYTVNSTVYRLEPGEVVHSRHGLDPANPRKGRSRMGALLRDIFTDDEAATFSAAVLANMGVMGVIISPADNDTVIEPEQASQMKTEFEQKTTGDNRGRTLVLSANVKVDQPTISPESMNLRDMRQVPEERISAVLGTPAVLVGLGAGLEHSIYNNYSEAREAAFEEHIIPLGKDLAEEFMIQLMPDFDDPDDVELDYDLSEVRVLQEDTNAKYERMVKAAGGPIMDVSEARQKLGLDALPTPFWWQPTMVSPTPVEELMGTAEPEPEPLPEEPAPEPELVAAGMGLESRIVSNGHTREVLTA